MTQLDALQRVLDAIKASALPLEVEIALLRALVLQVARDA
jgi:hypothetical protein